MAEIPIAVLISGRGTNLRRLLEVERGDNVSYRVAVVIADREAPGLEWAEKYDVPSRIVPWSGDRDAFTRALCDEIAAFDCEFVVLAGFMRVLAPIAIDQFRNRIVNIHPSLLPAFPGAHQVEDALAARVQETGVMVHIVVEAVDAGPILAQRTVPVLPDDDAATLHARIQDHEHELYPEVVDTLASGRLSLTPTGVNWS